MNTHSRLSKLLCGWKAQLADAPRLGDSSCPPLDFRVLLFARIYAAHKGARCPFTSASIVCMHTFVCTLLRLVLYMRHTVANTAVCSWKPGIPLRHSARRPLSPTDAAVAFAPLQRQRVGAPKAVPGAVERQVSSKLVLTSRVCRSRVLCFKLYLRLRAQRRRTNQPKVNWCRKLSRQDWKEIDVRSEFSRNVVSTATHHISLNVEVESIFT